MPASQAFLKPKLTIKDVTDATTYHTYDAFDPNAADIHLASWDLVYSMYAAPTLKIRIEDSGNTLNSAVKNGSRLIFDLGKTQGGLTRAFAGYVRTKDVLRRKTATFDMVLHGYGSGIRFDERVSNFFRMANRTTFGTDADPLMSDTTMSAAQLMTDLVTDFDHMPISEPDEGFDSSGIDTSITEVVPSLGLPFTEWSEIANMINDSVGTIWGVDENEVVYMRYPTLTASGITIRDHPGTIGGTSGHSANTCYFIDDWQFTDSIMKSDGFANRLYGRGGNEMVIDKFANTDTTNTTLFNQHLAMQFTPGDSWNAQAMGVLLSKVGTPPDSIQAVLRVDKSNTPGAAIASANLKTANIGTSVTQVTFGFPTSSSKMRNIQHDKSHWIEISACGSDASNCIRWHRDGLSSSRNAYKAPGGSWTVQSSSYGFAFQQLTTRQVLSEASDSDSIDAYKVVEAVIDAPWIVEGRTMDKYLSSILTWTARPKRIYTIPQCTIPDILVFPGTTAELIDTKVGFTTGNEAEVLEVHLSGNEKVNAMGTNRMALKLIQYPIDERLLART